MVFYYSFEGGAFVFIRAKHNSLPLDQIQNLWLFAWLQQLAKGTTSAMRTVIELYLPPSQTFATFATEIQVCLQVYEDQLKTSLSSDNMHVRKKYHR